MGSNLSSVSQHLRLISHKLCPYVQRAVIVAKEKDIPFHRVDIDLANKPDWFLALSPTGKVPLLEVTENDGTTKVLFESAVIAEYFDEIAGNPLLPKDPLERARQRAWVEFASATLADIGKLYSAADAASFDAATDALESRLQLLEDELPGHGSRASASVSSMPPSARCSDTSTCSIRPRRKPRFAPRRSARGRRRWRGAIWSATPWPRICRPAHRFRRAQEQLSGRLARTSRTRVCITLSRGALFRSLPAGGRHAFSLRAAPSAWHMPAMATQLSRSCPALIRSTA